MSGSRTNSASEEGLRQWKVALNAIREGKVSFHDPNAMHPESGLEGIQPKVLDDIYSDLPELIPDSDDETSESDEPSEIRNNIGMIETPEPLPDPYDDVDEDSELPELISDSDEDMYEGDADEDSELPELLSDSDEDMYEDDEDGDSELPDLLSDSDEDSDDTYEYYGPPGITIEDITQIER